MATINKPSQPLTPAADIEEVESLISDAIAADTSHAPLVENLVPAENLPSYVDDVLEFKSLDDFPEEGEIGKIYVALDTNYIYRWEVIDYIQIGGDNSEPIINHAISIICHLENDEKEGWKEFVIDNFYCDGIPDQWFAEDPLGLVVCNIQCELDSSSKLNYKDSFIIYKSDNNWVSLHYQWNLELEKNKLFVYCNTSGLETPAGEYYEINSDEFPNKYMLKYNGGESLVPIPSSGSETPSFDPSTLPIIEFRGDRAIFDYYNLPDVTDHAGPITPTVLLNCEGHIQYGYLDEKVNRNLTIALLDDDFNRIPVRIFTDYHTGEDEGYNTFEIYTPHIAYVTTNDKILFGLNTNSSIVDGWMGQTWTGR